MAFPNNFVRNGKYNAKKVVRHGIKFDSEREADRYDFLMDCQQRGLISELKRQVEFELLPDEYSDVERMIRNKPKIVSRRTYIGVKYRADFVYYHAAKGKHIVEDVKASPKCIPKEFELKEKMMHYLKGIDITRIYKPNTPI
jgi:hypothetical protein